MRVSLILLSIVINTVLSGLLWERKFLSLKLHLSSGTRYYTQFCTTSVAPVLKYLCTLNIKQLFKILV